MTGKLVKLEFPPGIFKESTEYAEEGKWFNADRVRFRDGKPECLRGYETKIDDTFDGNARDLLTWIDNSQTKRVMFGTDKKLFESHGDSLFDVTPLASTVTLTNCFGTSAGTTRVCVSDNGSNTSVGNFVNFTSAGTNLGGNINLSNKTYEIKSVVDANVYFISVTDAADATSTQAGNATFNYLISTGTSTAVEGLGYSAAKYQATVCASQTRAWNQPASAGSSGLVRQITQWSLDNYGEDVIAVRRKGPIFFFDTDASTSPLRLTTVTNSPATVDSVLVSPNDRHIIALGANDLAGDYNPMLVRWCDTNRRDNWTPSVSSNAGDNLLTDGTRIVGGVRSRNAVNIWTDNALWGMSFVGPPFVFKFQQLGSNCGLIAPHAAVDYNGASIWMGHDNFYINDGQVRVLPCTVRKHVFDELNLSQSDKIYAGINSEFNEIIWLYPSNNTTNNDCDKYVIYSPVGNYWTIGTTLFTTFADRYVFGNTITTGTSVAGSSLYDNEPIGFNSQTGAGETLSSFIESADFDIEDGNQLMFLNRMVPDFDLTDGNIKFSITTKDYPESTETVTKGPFTITKSTKKIDFRARGRQASIKVSTDSTEAKWRWGAIRVAFQPDGGR